MRKRRKIFLILDQENKKQQIIVKVIKGVHAMKIAENDILQMLKDKGAYLEGHFLLSSGLHSPGYIQCAQVLKYPELAERLGASIASFFPDQPADIVISPAIGGIIIGYEVARSLGVSAIFCERSEGEMKLRRGFEIIPGEQVLVVFRHE